MKQINLTTLFFLILCLAFIAVGGYLMGYHRATDRCEAVTIAEQADTTSRVDTSSWTKPEPEIEFIEKKIYIPYEVTDSSAIRQRDSLFAANGLLIQQVDSLTACLVRTKKEYSDSTYRAIVSGYAPSLDYIEVYPTETIIRNTQTVRAPAPRWGLGAAAGPGVFVATDGKVRAGGGVIIGVTYRF